MIIVVFCILLAHIICAPTSKYIAAIVQTNLFQVSDDIKSTVDQLFDLQIIINNATNYSQVQTIIDKGLFKAFEQIDSPTLIIEGEFIQASVKVNYQLTIPYQALIGSWWRLAGRRPLKLWLIGPASREWVYRCINAYDFDSFEVTALDGSGDCLYLGWSSSLLPQCNWTKVETTSKVIESAIVAYYNIADDQYSQYFIININNKTRILINETSNQTYVQCTSGDVLFGVMTYSNPQIIDIKLQCWQRIIEISSSKIIVWRMNYSLVEVYNYHEKSYYYGALMDGKFHGLGSFVQDNFRYVGWFNRGQRSGKGTSVQCNEKQHQECLIMARSNRLAEVKMFDGRLFRGQFKNDIRYRGAYRFRLIYHIGEFRLTESVDKKKGVSSYSFGLAVYFTRDQEIYRNYGFFFAGDNIYGKQYGSFTNFRGKFVKNAPGTGVYQFHKKGVYFIGDMIRGRPWGIGLHIDIVQHQKYFGEFKNGNKSGNGQYRTNSSIYIGEFLNDMVHGYGKQTYSLSRWREGLFYSGKFTKGIQFDNGRIIEGEVIGDALTQTTLVIEGNVVSKGRINFQSFYHLEDLPAITPNGSDIPPPPPVTHTRRYQMGNSLIIQQQESQL